METISNKVGKISWENVRRHMLSAVPVSSRRLRPWDLWPRAPGFSSAGTAQPRAEWPVCLCSSLLAPGPAQAAFPIAQRFRSLPGPLLNL